MATLIAPEPAPRGKVSKKDIKNALLWASVIGGVAAVIPVISAPVIVIGTVLQAFGVGFLTGGLGFLSKQFNTNSNNEFGKKEPSQE